MSDQDRLLDRGREDAVRDVSRRELESSVDEM